MLCNLKRKHLSCLNNKCRKGLGNRKGWGEIRRNGERGRIRARSLVMIKKLIKLNFSLFHFTDLFLIIWWIFLKMSSRFFYNSRKTGKSKTIEKRYFNQKKDD